MTGPAKSGGICYFLSLTLFPLLAATRRIRTRFLRRPKRSVPRGIPFGCRFLFFLFLFYLRTRMMMTMRSRRRRFSVMWQRRSGGQRLQR